MSSAYRTIIIPPVAPCRRPRPPRARVPPPALGPQIEHVVQVDVGEQRRNHRALPRPLLTDRDDPVLQHARPQPFLDQADDAWITDAMLDKADQPTLADFV